ncbi:ABC transporter permease [Calothrix sp. FACHB-1219]|uniref:ABC transporter permease n=1 Tax=unclassified Calothrix TaxID=2619626 RepID=UPI001687D659|nr:MULTISPECIES: ABC transporter permease [unclassified Calothrix]MBD2207130.1 ABC transporter permease [Calothrix sp. FACHB-168]MBD2221787.1 ABC transporter permease [Calothrix sp. FACHB-1219]
MGNQVVIIVGTFILLLTGLLLGYVLSQLVLGFLGFNLLNFLGTLSLILIFGTLYYVLFWQLRREQMRSQAFNPGLSNQTEAFSYENDLKNRLIARLDGDINTAEQLIEQARQNNPGMSEDWYIQKAIDDFDSDRE